MNYGKFLVIISSHIFFLFLFLSCFVTLIMHRFLYLMAFYWSLRLFISLIYLSFFFFFLRLDNLNQSSSPQILSPSCSIKMSKSASEVFSSVIILFHTPLQLCSLFIDIIYFMRYTSHAFL